jgi:acetyl-CoA acetyltransferase
MGHPLGATGAMITGTMVDELERRGAKRAGHVVHRRRHGRGHHHRARVATETGASG